MDELRPHLALLEQYGKAKIRYYAKIAPSVLGKAAIKKNLDRADIILLLVSAEFLISGILKEEAVARAIKRQKMDTALDVPFVFPLLVQSCNWKDTELGNVKLLPCGTKPLEKWVNINEACTAAASTLTSTVNNLIQVKELKAELREEKDRRRKAEEQKDSTVKGSYLSWAISVILMICLIYQKCN